MFTNQKLLGALLILFIIGAGVYFAVSKFKQEVSSVQASPSPSPSDLTFLFNQVPSSTPKAQTGTSLQNPKSVVSPPRSSPTGLPLAKNKTLSQFPGILKPEVLQNKKVVIQTDKGVIEIQIYPDVPITASNFILLAANGFYDGLIFHRIENEFVLQGGDPKGNGTGGPGYQFQDEAVTREYLKGTVAMANAGPNTNGSQFFIMLADHPELPKQYTIFGQVISGQDVVEKIAVGDVMQKVVVQNLQ